MAKSSSEVNSSFCRSVVFISLQVSLILAAICFTPGLPPDVEFSEYKLSVKPLSVNDKLNNAEKLFLGEVKGPEDLAVYNNELYTTTHGGYIQKIHKGKLVPVARFGKKCKGMFEEDICGRPLGLRFDSQGKGLLYVCDAYYGIYSHNVSNGTSSRIVSITEPIEGVRPMLPNSLDISKETGDIYWTDSSTAHHLYDGMFTMLNNGNGRLIHYNALKKTNKVLLKNLHFPNGLALSKDESFLVVAETFRARLLKYYLKGPQAGQYEIFAELPGFPDNVAYMDGKFYVAIVTVPDKLVPLLAQWPNVRKLISRLASLVELIIEQMNSLYPCDIFKKAIHKIGHFETITGLFVSTPIPILSYNEDGRLVENLVANDYKLQSISSVIKFEGYYYLGSPFNNYLGRVKIV